MKLLNALLISHHNTGHLQVKFDDVVYTLNPYGESIRDDIWDLRTGLGHWSERCLDHKHLTSNDFEPIEEVNG